MKSTGFLSRKPLVQALLPILACAPQFALAQSRGLSLEEVVVTAQRREETLQNAAIPISVVTGAELVSAGITTLVGLNELVPALTIMSTSTGNLMFIRGVGNFNQAPSGDSATAFNYDGIYLGRTTSSTGMFYDLERVEVLKGPQGTLYGRNATGGAINVIPVKPQLGGEVSGYVNGSFGEMDDGVDAQVYTTEGAVNVPVGDSTAVRLSGNRVDQDGIFEDGTSDDDIWSLRLQGLSEITDDLTVRMAGDYAERNGTGTSGTYLGRYAFDRTTGEYSYIPAHLPTNEGFYTDAAQDFRQTQFVTPAGRNLVPLAPYPYQNNRYYGTNAEINYATEMGTLTVVPSWRKSELDYLASAAAFPYLQNETDEQYSFEARFAGEVGIIDYIVGGYYYNEDVDIDTALSLSTVASWLDFKYNTESYAGFGRLTANLNESLRVVGGMRYTNDKKTADGDSIGGASVCITNVAPGTTPCPNGPIFPLVDSPDDLPFPFPPSPGVTFQPPMPPGASIAARTLFVANDDLENDRSTYRAAVEYDVAADSMLYTSVETGYRSGGFSPASGYETFSPEQITAYTVGSKNRFFDNQLEVNIEAFYWEYKDQQVSHVGIDANGDAANITENIGKSTIQGIEVQSSYLLTPTTLLRADVQYLDAQNDSFVYTSPNNARSAPPNTGCDVSAGGDGTIWIVDCSDQDSVNSPEWTANFSVQQSFALGDNYELIFDADTQYRASRWLGFDYLAEMKAESVWRSNAQLTLATNSDTWSVGAYVRNIENDFTPTYQPNSPFTNLLVASSMLPRNYGVRFSYRF